MRGLFKKPGSNNWYISYSDENGTTVRKTTGTIDWREARDIRTTAVNLVKEIKAGRTKRPLETKPHSFFELCDEYLKFCIGKKQARAKIKSYIIELFKKRYNDVPISDLISIKVFEDLQADLLSQGLDSKANLRRDEKNDPENPRRGMTEAGTDFYVGILKAMLGKASSWRWLSREHRDELEDIFDEFEMLSPDGRDRFASLEEIQALLAACSSYLRTIVVTALHTGMRKGEILKLKWTSVDLAHGFIVLPWSSTKTKKNRKIEIDLTMRTLFQSLPRRIDVPYVYYDPITLKPYGDVKRSFHTALEIAGILDFHFHDLRHTFASHYAMHNGDMRRLQEILGHATPKQTMKYTHLADKYRLAATNVMDMMPGSELIRKEEVMA